MPNYDPHEQKRAGEGALSLLSPTICIESVCSGQRAEFRRMLSVAAQLLAFLQELCAAPLPSHWVWELTGRKLAPRFHQRKWVTLCIGELATKIPSSHL